MQSNTCCFLTHWFLPTCWEWRENAQLVPRLKRTPNYRVSVRCWFSSDYIIYSPKKAGIWFDLGQWSGLFSLFLCGFQCAETPDSTCQVAKLSVLTLLTQRVELGKLACWVWFLATFLSKRSRFASNVIMSKWKRSALSCLHSACFAFGIFLCVNIKNNKVLFEVLLNKFCLSITKDN